MDMFMHFKIYILPPKYAQNITENFYVIKKYIY